MANTLNRANFIVEACIENHNQATGAVKKAGFSE